MLPCRYMGRTAPSSLSLWQQREHLLLQPRSCLQTCQVTSPSINNCGYLARQLSPSGYNIV